MRTSGLGMYGMRVVLAAHTLWKATLFPVLVKQWMLYRALAIDSENNATITKLAEQHKQTYFDLLKLAMAKQQAEEQQRDSLRIREDKATK